MLFYITSHYITSHYITSHHITSHHITLITLHYIALRYITSHYITSHYIASHYITSHHISSHHITSHYITSHYIVSHYIPSHYINHITLHHITLHHITSHHITSHYITSHYITSHHITSHHITSHHITSHHITSHHITSHYITLHPITLHHITLHLQLRAAFYALQGFFLFISVAISWWNQTDPLHWNCIPKFVMSTFVTFIGSGLCCCVFRFGPQNGACFSRKGFCEIYADWFDHVLSKQNSRHDDRQTDRLRLAQECSRVPTDWREYHVTTLTCFACLLDCCWCIAIFIGTVDCTECVGLADWLTGHNFLKQFFKAQWSLYVPPV